MRIYCDIDGVLADCSHRLKYINHKKKDYDKFYDAEEMVKDKPLYSVIPFLESADELILVTGRREECYDVTFEWFKIYFNIFNESQAIMMRDKNDLRQSSVIKAEKISYYEHLKPVDNVYFIDDDMGNINAVKKACPHITCILWRELDRGIIG